ncbi:type II toxin-antitoxin system RelE/ParE family toxin [Zavarzinia sp.]|uniref:type II toxin-antitoxin system RelE/ParE family toxin n=1 Tax=Zavarzinia sp. TaxID=2027920 RepID=UPI003BB7DF18
MRWTPEAIQDRETIYDHIEADNPVAALALDELLGERAARLVYQVEDRALLVLVVAVGKRERNEVHRIAERR